MAKPATKTPKPRASRAARTQPAPSAGGPSGDQALLAHLLVHHSQAIEAYEKKVAEHTALQTWTAWISLFVSVVTTGALIWLGWLQSQAADRQVALAYAIAAPNFDLEVDRESIVMPGRTPFASFPTAFEVLNAGAEVRVEDLVIDHYVDVQRSWTDEPVCTLRIRNWFRQDSELSGTGPNSSQVVFVGDPNVDFVSREVVVQVEYLDVFGDPKSQTLREGRPAEPSTVARAIVDAEIYTSDQSGSTFISAPAGSCDGVLDTRVPTSSATISD